MSLASQRSWTSRHYAIAGRGGGGSGRKSLAQTLLADSPREPSRAEDEAKGASPRSRGPILAEKPLPDVQERKSDDAQTARPRKRGVPPQTQRKKKFERPSLSSQLARIGAEANEITMQLTKTFGPVNGTSGQSGATDATLLFQVPAQSFVVGKLASKFPSVVHFYTNRCEYQFHHPFQAAQIHMIMYYRDMDEATLDVSRWTLRFRIPRDLFHYGADYDHRNARHAVEVTLSSEHDTRRVAKERARFPGGLKVLRRRAA